MCLFHLYSIGIPVVFIVSGMVYLSYGCLSEFQSLCFYVKPYNSYLDNFIFTKKNDTTDLYGRFILDPGISCIIPIEKSIHVNNTKIQSYNKYQINNNYEIFVSNYNNKCSIDWDNQYRICTGVGLFLIIIGNFIGSLIIYTYCFHRDNKVGIELNENRVQEISESTGESTIEITIYNQV